jgi:lipooligosaccharide transport system permease protein
VATPAVMRSYEYWLVRYRRTWTSGLVMSFVQPVLFLAALGGGLGSFVQRGTPEVLGGVSYAAFIGPGLLAASAMQTAANESTWPVLAAIKWQRMYHAMIATPLDPRDVLMGHLAWMATRVAAAAAGFYVVLLVFGLAGNATSVLAVPAAVLTGLAFAAPIAAYGATLEQDEPFALVWRLGIMPMFILSGTFFPVEQLPTALRVFAYVTPLWHGVDLSRDLVLGRDLGLSAAVHVGYLGLLTAAGMAWGVRNYRRRLAR